MNWGRKRDNGEDRREIRENLAEKYSRMERTFGRFYKWISAWTDRILFSQRYGQLVALILALFVYAIINIGDSASSIFETKQVYTFYAQPVTVLVNEETYEVSGVPETVDVQLQGDMNDLQMIRQQNNLSVVADLRQLGEGSSEIQLEVQNIPSRVQVFIESGNVNVVLKKKITRAFDLGYDFVNQSQMDATYDLGEPQFESDKVSVRASEDTLNNVSYVKALIDVTGVNSDFEIDAPLAAYDKNGEKLDVDIIPSTMKAKVSVTQPKKSVPIRVVKVGSMENDLAIETCTLSQDKITLYGKQSVLDQISSIDVSLPVSSITGDRTLKLPITLPSGITASDISEVSISVTVGKQSEKTFKDVPIKFVNLGDREASSDISSVDVTVYGGEEMLQKIDKEDIIVTADLKGLSENKKTSLALKVSGENRLVDYKLETSEISVTVTKK